MEKILKLYKYVNGVNDTPFPNDTNHVVITSFRYDAKRMGGSPVITCTAMSELCLDKLWDYNVYASFNGEMYFIKQIPTSSYDNSDSRYKHEIELVSERAILDNVYVYDVVDGESTQDKPVSNSSNFSFFGDISEFANRLNQSLAYSKVGYRIVVDEGITSEAKMVSFKDQFFSNAIQESYNTYNIPYYFVGKVIHFGYSSNAITRTFKYGSDESLLSIQKQNANYRIVNRITGVGSADNIPYYYPNDFESKDEVEANGGTWITPCTNLMPSIYRETLGKERFYNATEDFSNPFIEGKPKEHIVNFEDIKPTIVGVVNKSGLRIDMFKEFAFDLNDNDETDKEGNYLHPYFFGKLRKFDGEYGFNLFDHAIDEDEMTIAMTSGSCGGCEFIIGVDDENQKNLVQVDESGNLLRDEQGNVRCGREGMQKEEPQDKQNNTINNEVWVALKKDQSSFGIVMPNATNNYRPTAGDSFVILHIDLPKSYILSAEKKLEESLIKFMAENNDEKFNFSITFSRIFFAENSNILKELNENARIQIEYNAERYELYVSSFSYSMSSDKPLPEIRVELSDTITVTQNALQNAISEVKDDILSNIGNSQDFLKQGLRYFLRKDKDDTAKGNITFEKNIGSHDFVKGNLMGSGWSIYKDANGNTVVETDTIIARKGINASELIINQETYQKGSTIYVKGGCTITKVEEIDDVYRCYYDNEGGKRFSGFVVGDQARCQRYDSSYGLKIKYYWRLVVGVADDYVDLLITDFDGDGVPEAGDDIAQLGSRTEKTRQSAIVISPDNGGSVVVWAGIGDGEYPYSLSEKNMCGMGVDTETGRAYIYGYGDMFFGDRNNSSFVKFDIENGVEMKGKLSVGTKLSDGRILEDTLKSLSPEGYDELVVNVGKLSDKVDEFGTDLDSVKQQTDREFTIWFFNYEPTLYNEPASKWDTPELKAEHDQDMFYYRDAGKAWRFEKGEWKSITDQETIRSLELIAATRKEVDDMSYLTNALKSANPTVIENGLVMSSVVAVQNQEGDVEAFINGSNLAEDEEHGKLLLAGGIPEEGGTLEERSKQASTRIYEDGTLISENARITGEINATSGTFENVHINGTIQTKWKSLKYKLLYYSSSSIEQWGFDGSAIYDDKIILTGGLNDPELLIAWGDDADGREIAICNRCAKTISGEFVGLDVKVKVPEDKYIVDLDGTKISGGNEFNINGKQIYYMVGFYEGWYVTNILNLYD